MTEDTTLNDFLNTADDGPDVGTDDELDLSDDNERESTNDDSPNEPDIPLYDPEINICPCWTEERESSRWKELKEEHDLVDPGCGHALSYLSRVTNSKIRPTTARNYSYRLRRVVEFFHEKGVTFEEATIEDIEDLVIAKVQQNRSEVTLNSDISVISNVIKHIALFRDSEPSVRRDMIREVIDPSGYDTVTEIEREPLSMDEAEKLFAELNNYRGALIVQLGIELGPRSLDLRTIKLEDVDLGNQVITLKNTKKGGTYTLPIGKDLALRLRHWINNERANWVVDSNNGYLFPSKNGGHLSGEQLNRIIGGAAERAGIQEVLATIPFTPRQQKVFGAGEANFYRVSTHTLRHTFSDILDEAGFSLKDRSSALDHESIETTEKAYSHRSDEYKDTLRELFSNLDLTGS